MFAYHAFQEAFIRVWDLVGKIREKCEDGRLGLYLRDVIYSQIVSGNCGRRRAANIFEKRTVKIARAYTFLAAVIDFNGEFERLCVALLS